MKFNYVRYDGMPATCEIDIHRREGFTLVIASEEDGHRFGGDQGVDGPAGDLILPEVQHLPTEARMGGA